MWRVRMRGEVYRGFGWGNRRGRDHLGDQGVDGTIILRWIFTKWDVGACTGFIIIIIIIIIIIDMNVSCHRSFFRGTSLEPAVIPTAQASSFTLQYFP